MKETGLNLYSIRNLIDTDENFLQTAFKIREMGYKTIQVSGASIDVKLLNRVRDNCGLQTVLVHLPMDKILNDTNQLIDDSLSIGCFNIGLGMMPKDIIADEKKCLDTIEKLNKASIKIRERGCKFFYHHHHYEFFKFKSGITILDHMIENAPDINFTIDTYWLQYGGADICEYFAKVKGRADCVHLKDYKLVWDGNKNAIPVFAAIGEGTLNFKTIIEKAKEAGARHFIVEQDNAADFKNPLEEVKKSIDFIKNNYI